MEPEMNNNKTAVLRIEQLTVAQSNKWKVPLGSLIKAGLPGKRHQGSGPSPGPWRTRCVGQAEGQWSAGTNIPELTQFHLQNLGTTRARALVLFTLYFLHLELNICGMPEWIQDLGLGRILSFTRHSPWGWVKSGAARWGGRDWV